MAMHLAKLLPSSPQFMLSHWVLPTQAEFPALFGEETRMR